MHILFRVLGLSHRLTTAFSFLFFCTFFFSFSYFILYVPFFSFLFDSFNFPCLCSLWCIILLPSYFLALSALPGIVMPAWCCCVFGLLLSSFNFSPPHCQKISSRGRGDGDGDGDGVLLEELQRTRVKSEHREKVEKRKFLICLKAT